MTACRGGIRKRPEEHMRKLYFLMAVLACALFAAGCGRTVEVVQARQFKIMADRMPEELMARGILDASRDYVTGLWDDGGGEYGMALFTRLVPDFLFEDAAGKLSSPSFAATVKAGDVVRRHDAGFVIQGMRRNIGVNMIAVTDWDGDGRKDWLISCLVEDSRGGKSRDYYVIVADPPAKGPLRGAVAAVYESFGLAGRLYMRESRAQAGGAPADGGAEETVPGLRAVTVPPHAGSGGKNEEGGKVRERAL